MTPLNENEEKFVRRLVDDVRYGIEGGPERIKRLAKEYDVDYYDMPIIKKALCERLEALKPSDLHILPDGVKDIMNPQRAIHREKIRKVAAEIAAETYVYSLSKDGDQDTTESSMELFSRFYPKLMPFDETERKDILDLAAEMTMEMRKKRAADDRRDRQKHRDGCGLIITIIIVVLIGVLFGRLLIK